MRLRKRLIFTNCRTNGKKYISKEEVIRRKREGFTDASETQKRLEGCKDTFMV
jgi:hypothetical protein